MSGGDTMAFAAHGQIKQDDQGRTVRASRNRKFESISLQRRVSQGPSAAPYWDKLSPIDLENRGLVASSGQCDIRTGTVMCWRSSRLTPPIRASRSCEW